MRSISVRSGGCAGVGLRARTGWAALLLLAPALANGDGAGVTLEATSAGCRVRGGFHAPVADSLAWSVLTDYDHIGDFVRSIVSSRVERRGDRQVLLRQEAIGRVFLLRRRVQVLLEVQEEPGRRIAFHDVLGKDFRDYAGAWSLVRDSTGMRVDYELEAEPRGRLAHAFCRGALRRTAQDLLEQVRAEMLRRARPDAWRRSGAAAGG